MMAYVYKAALLCESCGKAKREALDAYDPPDDPNDESSYDSDDYPKGPYPDGGGEADCPQHCDTCAAFLENPLTADGRAYVEQRIREGHDVIAVPGKLGVVWHNPIFKHWSEFYQIRPGG